MSLQPCKYGERFRRPFLFWFVNYRHHDLKKAPKIEIFFFWPGNLYTSGASHDIADGQEKIGNPILDLKKYVYKFDALLYIDTFSVAFGAFISSIRFLNIWDFVDFG